jgi:hypothetical protein
VLTAACSVPKHFFGDLVRCNCELAFLWWQLFSRITHNEKLFGMRKTCLIKLDPSGKYALGYMLLVWHATVVSFVT